MKLGQQLLAAMLLLLSIRNVAYFEDVTMACLEKCFVFFEGSTQHREVLWPSVSTFQANTDFMAVEIITHAAGGGIMATSSPFKSLSTDNKRWRCMPALRDILNWYTKDFDDSSWPDAHFVSLNDDCHFQDDESVYDRCIEDMDKYAMWIWSLPRRFSDEEEKQKHSIVRCRLNASRPISWNYKFPKTLADGEFGNKSFPNKDEYKFYLLGVIFLTFTSGFLLSLVIPFGSHC